jgi:hypothetical protein
VTVPSGAVRCVVREKARGTRRGEAWVAGKGRRPYIPGSKWRMLSTSNCKER